MKNLTAKLGFAIYLLFITNIWVILFNTLVLILNSLFPPHIKEVFITQPGAGEQFEIPVYILLSAFFILFIIFTHKLIQNIDKLSFFLKLFSLVILIIFFLYMLGTYPLSNQYDPYLPRADKSVYFIVVFFYCLISTLVIASGKLLKGKVLYLFVILLLGLITFDAGFPLTGHDYEHFIGPSYEIARGKTIYTDILSRYAFLTPIIFAVLNKLKILPLSLIPTIVWLLYIIQYFFCFYLIKKISKSDVFALLGTAAILTLNYFSLSHLPSVIPQVGPLRWLPMILLIFLLYKFKRLDSFWFIFSVALSSLFMIDSGIAIILSYFTTLFFSLVIGNIIKERILRVFFIFILSLLGIILLINLLHLLFGYKLINMTGALYSLKKFALSGLSLMPMSQKNYFWLVPLIYFASLIYFFKQKKIELGVASDKALREADFRDLRKSLAEEKSHERQNLTQLLLFSANISLFTSIYFIGRSHPHNLFNISIFPLLNFFLLIAIVLKSEFKKDANKFLLATIYLLLATFIIFIPAFQRRITLTEMILTKINLLKKGDVFKSEVNEIIKIKYKEEINLIKNNLPDETLILSADDTYLFNATGKKNLLDANPIMGIDVEEDIDFALKNTIKNCPKKIAVDCSYIGKCPSYTPFVVVTFNLNLILNKLESGCKIKYKPVQCTDKLCIISL